MRVLLLSILALSAVCSAQESAAKRTCRLVFLNPPPSAPAKLYLFDGVSSQEVELPKRNFSKVYQVAGGDTAITLLTAPVLKAEELPAGAPVKKLSATITDFYVIAMGDPKNTVVPVQFQIIDAGSDTFKKGQMMWYNLTAFPVGGQLGSEKLALKPQARQIINAPAKEPGGFDVDISYLMPNDANFHPICQTQWIYDPRSRMVMFVYGGGGNAAPEIAGFKDFRGTPEKGQ